MELTSVCFVQGWKRVLARVHGLHDQQRNGEREVKRGDRERFPCSQRREQALRHQGRTLPGTKYKTHAIYN